MNLTIKKNNVLRCVNDIPLLSEDSNDLKLLPMEAKGKHAQATSQMSNKNRTGMVIEELLNLMLAMKKSQLKDCILLLSSIKTKTATEKWENRDLKSQP